MDKHALALSNHFFFYVELTQGCLLTEAFEEACRTGAREAVYRRELYPEYDLLDDGWQQASFVCRNGELGYLRFSNDTAQLIMEKQVDAFLLASRISSSIQGEYSERCEFVLDGGLRVVFEIVDYEGDLGDGYGCVEIKDPVLDCPLDDIPLGRRVEMTISV